MGHSLKKSFGAYASFIENKTKQNIFSVSLNEHIFWIQDLDFPETKKLASKT